MRLLLGIALLALTGCLKPGDSKVRPEEPAARPVSYRPITPDMVTAESAQRMSDRLDEEIDREEGKRQKAEAKRQK